MTNSSIFDNYLLYCRLTNGRALMLLRQYFFSIAQLRHSLIYNIMTSLIDPFTCLYTRPI